MSDINFVVEESPLEFNIIEESIDFLVEDTTIEFNEVTQNLVFDVVEETLDFVLGEGASVITNVVPYASEADIVSDTLIYKGEAPPGSLITDSTWRISRVTISGPDQENIKIEWANGFNDFSYAWVDRLSLNYS